MSLLLCDVTNTSVVILVSSWKYTTTVTKMWVSFVEIIIRNLLWEFSQINCTITTNNNMLGWIFLKFVYTRISSRMNIVLEITVAYCSSSYSDKLEGPIIRKKIQKGTFQFQYLRHCLYIVWSFIKIFKVHKDP